MMDTEEGGLGSNDESEVGSEEELIVQLIMETGGSVPDYITPTES
jgi:hypothetical protein